ncbi:MAG: 3-isopropylmalate dehydratase [Acidimicrobiales bacterium]
MSGANSDSDNAVMPGGGGPVLRGRVWKFGHDVDTDVMAPWGVIAKPFEERRDHVLRIRPEFAAEVAPGDLIVAGRNWGCGSSREQAPENLALLGVGAVVAESFGRIYFRNAIAQAFPNVACPGIWEATDDGDELEVHLATATVRNLRTGAELTGRPYTPEMLAIVEAGGLLEVLRRKVAAGELGDGGPPVVETPVPAPDSTRSTS